MNVVLGLFWKSISPLASGILTFDLRCLSPNRKTVNALFDPTCYLVYVSLCVFLVVCVGESAYTSLRVYRSMIISLSTH